MNCNASIIWRIICLHTVFWICVKKIIFPLLLLHAWNIIHAQCDLFTSTILPFSIYFCCRRVIFDHPWKIKMRFFFSTITSESISNTRSKIILFTSITESILYFKIVNACCKVLYDGQRLANQDQQKLTFHCNDNQLFPIYLKAIDFLSNFLLKFKHINTLNFWFKIYALDSWHSNQAAINQPAEWKIEFHLNSPKLKLTNMHNKQK